MQILGHKNVKKTGKTSFFGMPETIVRAERDKNS